jgi:hypothetical protein
VTRVIKVESEVAVERSSEIAARHKETSVGVIHESHLEITDSVEADKFINKSFSCTSSRGKFSRAVRG